MQHKIPLELQELLKPIIIQNADVVKPVLDEKNLFKLIPNNPNLPFHFLVISCKDGSGDNYLVEYKPRSSKLVDEFRTQISATTIEKSIYFWIKTLKAYNAIGSLYEDPILRYNRENLEKKFTLKDEDANYNPYNFEQQVKLEFLARKLNTLLLDYKAKFPNKNEVEIIEIIDDINELTDNITRETKSKIFSRVITIFAKIQKTNLPLFKAVIKKFTFDFAVQLSVEVAVRLLTK